MSGSISDSSPKPPNGSRMERIIFSADIRALSLYTSCTRVENPGEKESPNEFIKESLGLRSINCPQLDLRRNESANHAGETRREKFHGQTPHTAGE